MSRTQARPLLCFLTRDHAALLNEPIWGSCQPAVHRIIAQVPEAYLVHDMPRCLLVVPQGHLLIERSMPGRSVAREGCPQLELLLPEDLSIAQTTWFRIWKQPATMNRQISGGYLDEAMQAEIKRALKYATLACSSTFLRPHTASWT